MKVIFYQKLIFYSGVVIFFSYPIVNPIWFYL
ncbi:MAG: hypothetical protein BWY31_00190 [Lentisphaerae bacterium ADurb.Bin242]|nr:MAG: hypothetical protein BWY31_00190 [Lentisphaerae bacterium ADurb.Bin242]